MSEGVTKPSAGGLAWPLGAVGTAIAAVLAVTILRIFVLGFSFVNLGPDEAQYWSWSRHLAFGYFTKPPLIAWLIAGTTSVCGNGEACVRLSSPLMHGGIAIIVFYLARRLYDERIALWSCIVYATLPMVWFSAGLITTDVPLVLCWAGALLALDRLIEAETAGRRRDAFLFAALAGFAIGLGFLAKYAMIYFVLCTAVYCVFSDEARRALLSPAGALLAAIALGVYSPNLIWNAREGFATFEHTAANANWGAELFNLRELAEFLLSQVGIFGPIMTALFLFGLLTLGKRLTPEYRRSDLFLLCYALPIFAIMLAQAFISRANANWAAPAYIAVVILTVAWIFRIKARKLLYASLIIHLISGAVLYSAITIPSFIEVLGLENSFKRVRGWDTLGQRVAELTSGSQYKAVVADDRELIAELVYYARDTELPIVLFDFDGHPQNEFELESPYTPALGDPVLLVPRFSEGGVMHFFEQATPVEVFRMEQGGDRHFDFHLTRLSGFKGLGG